jgi:hypothetical protein
LLESGKALALRKPLAGPLKFVISFCKREYRVPASGGQCQRLSSSSSTSTCLRQASAGFLSDLRWDFRQNRRFRSIPGRSDKRRSHWTVEVERVLETPSNRPPQAETPLCASQKAATNVNRPASGSRSASALSDSSKRPPIGRKIATDKNLVHKFPRANCVVSILRSDGR